MLELLPVEELGIMEVVSELDLLSQIDEFRKRAEALQTAIEKRENQANELEDIVTERQIQAEELELIIAEREKQADVVSRVIHTEMEGVSASLDDKVAKLRAEMDQSLEKNFSDQTQSLSELTSRLDQISEKLSAMENTTESMPQIVHSEGVQVYRNTQELMRQMEERLDSIERVDAHVNKNSGLIACTLVFSIVSVLGVAAAIVLSLGII